MSEKTEKELENENLKLQLEIEKVKLENKSKVQKVETRRDSHQKAMSKVAMYFIGIPIIIILTLGMLGGIYDSISHSLTDKPKSKYEGILAK